MKSLLRWFRRKSSPEVHDPPPSPNALEIANAVREAESAGPIEPGKALHVLAYDELTIRIDRDIIGLLRITASQDTDRRYSFSIRCNPDEWDPAFEQVFNFLASERALKDLPVTDKVKGHFYGYGDE